MNILIDIRPLMVPQLSGVGEYTYHLVDAMIRMNNHRFFLWSNSFDDPGSTVFEHARHIWGRFPHVEVCFTRWPNKVLHSSMAFLGRPRIERMVLKGLRRLKGLEGKGQEGFEGIGGRIDAVFMPNMHFFATGKHTRLVVTVHDMSFEIYPEFFTWKDRARHTLVTRRILARADAVIAVSQNTKRDLVDVYGVHERKISVVYPGVDGEGMRGDKGLRGEKQHEGPGERLREKYDLPQCYILFLGTLEPRKNIVGLVRAYEELVKIYPQSPDLVIAGLAGWHERPIIEMVECSPQRARIHMAGYIDPSDKNDLYQCADLFVYPSFYEGFGFPPLEALAAGTPTIVGAVGSLPEMTGDAALIVDPYNIQELAETMQQVLRDEELRTRLRERGFENVKRFRWEESAKKVLEVLTV